MNRAFLDGRRLFVLLFGLLWLCAAPMAASAADVAEAARRLIDDVKYLADDELEGRGVGTKGLDLAADFVRDAFEHAGLDVTRVDGGAFQTFSLVTGSEQGDNNVLVLTGPDGPVELKLTDEFLPCSFGGAGEFETDIVFAGYGIEDPDSEYNDFDGLDLKGKAALILRRTPQQGNPHGPFASPHGGLSRHADINTKVSNAFGKGAAAVLLVNDPFTGRREAEQHSEQIVKGKDQVIAAAVAFDAADPQDEKAVAEARKELSAAVEHLRILRERAKKPDDPLMAFGYGGHGKDDSIPVFHIRQAVADRLLSATLGKTLEELEAEIDGDLQPRSALLEGWRMRGRADVRRVRAEVKNVIGVLEGEGPLADETLVIGAHYDHVGWGGEGSGSKAPGVRAVHNGADDNASGTAGLIELARRLAAQPERLPRRVVFIAFTAEEIGLIGSARYVNEPIVPLEQTIAMLNMDMIGRLRDDKLTVFGTGTAPVWEDLLKAGAGPRSLELVFKPEGFGPSDQSSFYAKKIPVLHFFTGTHRDYHMPSDTWEKINPEGMARVVDLIEEVAVSVASAPERPQYVEVKQPESQARTGSRPYFGSIPDFGTEEPGYALSGVAPGSPAARGGLKAGDRIVEFGGQKISSLNDFDLALRKFSAGEQVDVVVVRDGDRVELKVTLDQPR